MGIKHTHKKNENKNSPASSAFSPRQLPPDHPVRSWGTPSPAPPVVHHELLGLSDAELEAIGDTPPHKTLHQSSALRLAVVPDAADDGVPWAAPVLLTSTFDWPVRSPRHFGQPARQSAIQTTRPWSTRRRAAKTGPHSHTPLYQSFRLLTVYTVSLGHTFSLLTASIPGMTTYGPWSS